MTNTLIRAVPWTKKTPEVIGYYWLSEPAETQKAKEAVVLVELFEGLGGMRVMFLRGFWSKLLHTMPQGCEWMKIEQPTL